MVIALTTAVIRKPDVIFTDMDGDVVAINIDKGEYYGIGGIGSRIWVLLENNITIQGIVDAICSEYEVDEETCTSDTIKFINELMENGMVVSA